MGSVKKLSRKGKKEMDFSIKGKENNDMKIHPFWHGLMKYVKENGGYMKLNIRFKDGIPIEADEIRKKVRFDINDRGG